MEQPGNRGSQTLLSDIPKIRILMFCSPEGVQIPPFMLAHVFPGPEIPVLTHVWLSQLCPLGGTQSWASVYGSAEDLLFHEGDQAGERHLTQDTRVGTGSCHFVPSLHPTPYNLSVTFSPFGGLSHRFRNQPRG